MNKKMHEAYLNQFEFENDKQSVKAQTWRELVSGLIYDSVLPQK